MGVRSESELDEGMKDMPQLRCLYFEDEDDDYQHFSVFFKRALAGVADLLIERAKTPADAYQKLKRQGKDLNLFFADLLIKENATEGLRLVEYITDNFPHILVIGVSKADGTLPGTSHEFKKVAGPDSVFFDKYALKSPRYSYRDVIEEILKVAPRKNILGSAAPATVEAPNPQEPKHGEDRNAKYIFLDIVGFTRNRSVNAQADIIKELNRIVSETVNEKQIVEGDRIYLPTGDGLCIVLLVEHPIDIPIQIALGILERLAAYNDTISDEARNFEVRIGIESGEDVLVADINGRQNIAGEGINTASRTMDLADGGQILVGKRVYDSLKVRDNYHPEKFRHYPATVKHGTQLSVYQFIGEGQAGLNLNNPSSQTAPANAKTEVPNIIHGPLTELFGIIEKRSPLIGHLRIYANASTNIQPVFANSRLSATKCEIILREPKSEDPDSTSFLQHLGHMLKEWDELRKAGRIGDFECRRSRMVPTEWQVIFDDNSIICGLNVPDGNDWLGIDIVEPFLIDDSSSQGKSVIEKYVTRFDRFFQQRGAPPTNRS